MIQNYDLKEISQILEDGGLILYPTDTIWGIGCDATNQESVDRVHKLKQRKSENGFIILVNSIEMIKEYVESLHPRIETLLLFHKSPLTIIYENAKNLPDNVKSSDGSIGIRLSHDKFCNDLIAEFGKPIVSTSANISNEPYPLSFGFISSAIIEGVEHVVKHRQFERLNSQPSPMAKLSEKAELIFLRE